MGMFGGLQPQRPSIMDDPRLMQMPQVDPRDMASIIRPDTANGPFGTRTPIMSDDPRAGGITGYNPRTGGADYATAPQGGMMQQGVPAPSPHAYDAAPVIPPSVMSAPDLAGPSSQINPYDMMSMGHDAGARTANIGQQMQPAPSPQSGGGLLGGGGFLGTAGKIGGGILDILKYGPFVAEAHANQRAAQQRQQIAYTNAATAYQNANRPTYQSSGDDLIGIPKDGSAPFVAYHGQPKSAQLAVGQHYDPTTDTVSYANGVESPAQKVARESQDASDKQDHQDAYQAAMFGHQDKMESSRQAHSDAMQANTTARMMALLTQRQGGGGFGAAGIDGAPNSAPGVDTVASAIASGDAPAPRNTSSPASQALLRRVLAINPKWSGNDFTTKQATRKDFTSGKTAQSVASFNTLLGHAAGLQDALGALHNGSVGPVNAITNAVAGMTGEGAGVGGAAGRLAAVATHLSGVSDEAPRAFSGSAPTVSGIQNWAHNFSANATPDAQKAAFGSLGTMLKSRMEALDQKYKTGMGQQADATQLFTPDAIAAYRRLTGGGSATGTPKTPMIGQVVQGHKYTGGNPGNPASWAAVQ